MPLYEHVFIARPDLSPQQAEALIETYGDVLRTEGGSVGKTEYWGLRSLAYRIKRYRKGHYSLMHIDASHKAVAEMERRMRLSSEVVRFLTVSVDALDDRPSPPMMAMKERAPRRDAREKDGDTAKKETAEKTAADATDTADVIDTAGAADATDSTDTMDMTDATDTANATDAMDAPESEKDKGEDS